jgi:hypothetical protein
LVFSSCHLHIILFKVLQYIKNSYYSLSLIIIQFDFPLIMSASPETPARVFESISRNPTASPTLTRTHTNGSRVNPTHRNSSQIRRNSTGLSQKETRDPNLDVNLPYRTFTEGADLSEYTTEQPSGEVEGRLEPDGEHHYKLVTFLRDDPENPKNWSKAFKWYCTMVVAVTCFVVAFASSVITADIGGVEREFNVSEEVALVSISIFVVGFGLGMFLLLVH